MTHEEAKKVAAEFLADVKRGWWMEIRDAGNVPVRELDGYAASEVATALDLLLRSDSDVRREERERCAKVVESRWTLPAWGVTRQEVAKELAALLRSLEDEP